MCLLEASRNVRIGYVIFLEYEKGVFLYPSYRKVDNRLPEDMWLDEKTYGLAWYVFEDEETAMKVLLRLSSHLEGFLSVSLRKVRCKGFLTMGRGNVGVYKSIKIEGDYGYFTEKRGFKEVCNV